MKYKFWKYQGTGNDFIFFDGRADMSAIKDNQPLIERLCDRRFGIGGDGLIILEEVQGADFQMVYYNSDGRRSTMCGNGGRCAIAFAREIGMIALKTHFLAVDGIHEGHILQDQWVSLGMIDVNGVKKLAEDVFELNTGSPHYVKFVDRGQDLNIFDYGRQIRFSDTYQSEGINVNLVSKVEGGIEVRTYERGVEDETFSCGTGVTAAAIAYYELTGRAILPKIDVITKGGALSVSFTESDGHFSNIVLGGPAVLVYEGEIDL